VSGLGLFSFDLTRSSSLLLELYWSVEGSKQLLKMSIRWRKLKRLTCVLKRGMCAESSRSESRETQYENESDFIGIGAPHLIVGPEAGVPHK
jgi:hypothetical protein